MTEPDKSKYSPEGIAASVALIAMVATVSLQVVGRAGLAHPPIWTEELSRWLFVWMILLGLPEVERKQAHLQVDLVPGMLPLKLRMIVFMIIDAVLVLVMGQLIWVGYKTVMRTLHAAAVTMPTSDAVLYAAFPVAGILVVIRVLQRMAERVRTLRS